MNRRRPFSKYLPLIMATALLAVSGCDNGNLFGKLYDRGDNSDVTSLNADAALAFRDKSYTEALALYERVLAQDPNNSEALYGSAKASMAAAGLNFSQIIANIVSSSASGAPALDLGDFIQASIEIRSNAADPDSLLHGINLESVDAALDRAICRMQKIAAGSAQGSVGPNDKALLMDYAAYRLVRSITRAILDDYFDIIDDGSGSYDYVEGAGFTAACGVPADEARVLAIAQDMVAAYAIFNRLVTVSGVNASTVVTSLRDDIGDITEDLLTNGNPKQLPLCWITYLNTNGISAASFRTDNSAFSTPTCD